MSDGINHALRETKGRDQPDWQLRQVAQQLSTALKMWVDLFKELDADGDRNDPLAVHRRNFHAKRLAAARAALTASRKLGVVP